MLLWFNYFSKFVEPRERIRPETDPKFKWDPTFNFPIAGIKITF
jgi:hypothetical protein